MQIDLADLRSMARRLPPTVMAGLIPPASLQPDIFDGDRCNTFPMKDHRFNRGWRFYPADFSSYRAWGLLQSPRLIFGGLRQLFGLSWPVSTTKIHHPFFIHNKNLRLYGMVDTRRILRFFGFYQGLALVPCNAVVIIFQDLYAS